MKPITIIALTFALLICIGTVFLTLPISHNDGRFFPLAKALFTATSAVCVTGLVVVDTATQFSFFGQLIIIILIQLGGLGLMTVATLVFILAGKKITLKERLVLQEAYGADDLSGLVKLTVKIAKYAFGIEFIGAIILSITFIGDYGLLPGIWKGVFHSISAFCNAGFDILGNGNSMTIYQNNIFVLLPIMMLITLGGIGFCVINDINTCVLHKKRLTMHSKIALIVSAVFLLGGAVLYFLLEYTNKATIGDMGLGTKILSSFFQSVTTRTAGFNTISQADLSPLSTILTNFFMFVGASPSGTGGGIKTTTFFAVLIMCIVGASGKEDIVAFNHSIKIKSAMKALGICGVGIAVSLGIAVVLFLAEGQLIDFTDVMFESFSAYGTVGLSRGITGSLNNISLFALIVEMYIGRLGSLFMGLVFVSSVTSKIKFPELKLIIG